MGAVVDVTSTIMPFSRVNSFTIATSFASWFRETPLKRRRFRPVPFFLPKVFYFSGPGQFPGRIKLKHLISFFVGMEIISKTQAGKLKSELGKATLEKTLNSFPIKEQAKILLQIIYRVPFKVLILADFLKDISPYDYEELRLLAKELFKNQKFNQRDAIMLDISTNLSSVLKCDENLPFIENGDTLELKRKSSK